MARAVFTRPFRFDRRPKHAVAFEIRPGPEPQSFPADVIAAAVEAGAARPVRPARRRSAADLDEETSR